MMANPSAATSIHRLPKLGKVKLGSLTGIFFSMNVIGKCVESMRQQDAQGCQWKGFKIISHILYDLKVTSKIIRNHGDASHAKPLDSIIIIASLSHRENIGFNFKVFLNLR